MGEDIRKVGLDNKKALELDNGTVFHKGKEQKSSRAGQNTHLTAERIWLKCDLYL